ncbi:chemotaxis protein CheW, partial [Myxococcota bacterium]|nr:chemotaxis protein CheW [Myxococcota bacterium]
MSENQREFLEEDASESESRSNTIRSRVAGKYMTFKLADEEYGVEILKVRDINRLMQITRVPGTKTFIRGVINLRGKVIPVIDLRLKFAMAAVEDTERTCIIVVQVDMNDTVV